MAASDWISFPVEQISLDRFHLKCKSGSFDPGPTSPRSFSISTLSKSSKASHSGELSILGHAKDDKRQNSVAFPVIIRLFPKVWKGTSQSSSLSLDINFPSSLLIIWSCNELSPPATEQQSLIKLLDLVCSSKSLESMGDGGEGTKPSTATCFSSTGTTPQATQSISQAIVASTVVLVITFAGVPSLVAAVELCASFTRNAIKQLPQAISNESDLCQTSEGRNSEMVGYTLLRAPDGLSIWAIRDMDSMSNSLTPLESAQAIRPPRQVTASISAWSPGMREVATIPWYRTESTFFTIMPPPAALVPPPPKYDVIPDIPVAPWSLDRTSLPSSNPTINTHSFLRE